jgi:hypothetical protein
MVTRPVVREAKVRRICRLRLAMLLKIDDLAAEDTFPGTHELSAAKGG